jgi:hypothetical protein
VGAGLGDERGSTIVLTWRALTDLQRFCRPAGFEEPVENVINSDVLALTDWHCT